MCWSEMICLYQLPNSLLGHTRFVNNTAQGQEFMNNDNHDTSNLNSKLVAKDVCYGHQLGCVCDSVKWVSISHVLFNGTAFNEIIIHNCQSYFKLVYYKQNVMQEISWTLEFSCQQMLYCTSTSHLSFNNQIRKMVIVIVSCKTIM